MWSTEITNFESSSLFLPKCDLAAPYYSESIACYPSFASEGWQLGVFLLRLSESLLASGGALSPTAATATRFVLPSF